MRSNEHIGVVKTLETISPCRLKQAIGLVFLLPIVAYIEFLVHHQFNNVMSGELLLHKSNLKWTRR